MTHKNFGFRDTAFRAPTGKIRRSPRNRADLIKVFREQGKVKRGLVKKPMIAMNKSQRSYVIREMPSPMRAAPLKADRGPISDYVKAAAQFGVAADAPVPTAQVTKVMKAVAEDSIDLFGSVARAMSFLKSAPIDHSGRKATDVMKTAGIVPVLVRLDSLRYGPQG